MLLAALFCFLGAVMAWWWVEVPQSDGGTERLYVTLWDRLRLEGKGEYWGKIKAACILSLVELLCAMFAGPILIVSSVSKSMRLANLGSWLTGGCMCASIGTLVLAAIAHEEGTYRHTSAGSNLELVGAVLSTVSWWIMGKRHTSSAAEADVNGSGSGVIEVCVSPRSMMM